MLNLKNFILLVLFLLIGLGCTPKEMKINLYTADIEAVKGGDTVPIPVEVTFSMPGKDKDNSLEKAKNVVKNYLPPDSSFTITKGKYSKYFVVKTTIPMTTKAASNNDLGVLTFYPSKRGPKFGSVQFNPSKSKISELNKKLRKISYALSLNLPATNYIVRIISDSREPIKLNAYSTWVSKKPYVFFSKTIKRREEAELIFKGSSASIYSQIPIFFNVEFAK